MREQLVAWAEDCRVRGEVDLDDGRLSDVINDLPLLTFLDATLEALADGHEVARDVLEVERNELHLIEVKGRRGDPARRLRTIPERARLELGPYTVTGDLHRSPAAHSLAALAGWAHFVPVTGAVVSIAGRDGDPLSYEVVLVNRGRVRKYEPLDAVPVFADEIVSQPASATLPGSAPASAADTPPGSETTPGSDTPVTPEAETAEASATATPETPEPTAAPETPEPTAEAAGASIEVDAGQPPDAETAG